MDNLNCWICSRLPVVLMNASKYSNSTYSDVPSKMTFSSHRPNAVSVMLQTRPAVSVIQLPVQSMCVYMGSMTQADTF